jgi:formate-nitrite transporter family protein
MADREDNEVEEKCATSAYVVYRAISVAADEELEHPTSALACSGLAAGMSMGFSLVAEGARRTYLPDGHWCPLVSKFGFSVGFLIVIFGRQQLLPKYTDAGALTSTRPQREHVMESRPALGRWC